MVLNRTTDPSTLMNAIPASDPMITFPSTVTSFASYEAGGCGRKMLAGNDAPPTWTARVEAFSNRLSRIRTLVVPPLAWIPVPDAKSELRKYDWRITMLWHPTMSIADPPPDPQTVIVEFSITVSVTPESL